MRNPDTEWCVSHNQLAKGVNMGNGAWAGGCKKRIGLTATPVFNKPMDMVGLCKALHTAVQFQSKEYWSLDKKGFTINPNTVRQFQQFTDRVKDDILDLPAIFQKNFNYDAELHPADAAVYNAYLQDARQLRIAIERARGNAADLQRLMALLQKMQQMLVSPILAEKGAAYLKQHPIEIDNAAQAGTGTLSALYKRIRTLKAEGHKHIIVASNHVVIMRVAMKYIRIHDPDLAELFLYDGSLSLDKRQEERAAFLRAEQSVLFLSIGAGGTGLHLVPGADTPKEGFCRAMIFWGSRPFSPMQVWQTLKRIHRIGAKHDVYVHHLIPYGGVDYAISKVHSDKQGLAAAIVDDDWSNCDEKGGNWKKTGRIVDSCVDMMDNGNFPPQPEDMPDLPILHQSTKVVAKQSDEEVQAKFDAAIHGEEEESGSGSGSEQANKGVLPELKQEKVAPQPPANLHPLFNPPQVPRHAFGPAVVKIENAGPSASQRVEAADHDVTGPVVKMEM